jgi:hypothetical protein
MVSIPTLAKVVTASHVKRRDRTLCSPWFKARLVPCSAQQIAATPIQAHFPAASDYPPLVYQPDGQLQRPYFDLE